MIESAQSTTLTYYGNYSSVNASDVYSFNVSNATNVTNVTEADADAIFALTTTTSTVTRLPRAGASVSDGGGGYDLIDDCLNLTTLVQCVLLLLYFQLFFPVWNFTTYQENRFTTRSLRVNFYCHSSVKNAIVIDVFSGSCVGS